jgi:Spy/CpxP family protein refolding chaperone
MTIRSLKLGIMAALLVVSPLSTGAAQRGGGERQGGPGRMNRQQLEQNVRVRLSNLLRTQLGLNDDQMRQLSDVNQRFDQQRREMLRREMMTRRSLRDEVMKQDSANAGRIEQLLTEQFKIERERIDLTESEQRELGKFLTPVQRAKYLGVQEQIRREMEQLRGRRGGMPPGGDSADAFRRRRPPPPA